jgi:hypothetical protein
MLTHRATRPGFRATVLAAVAAATLLVAPATAGADLPTGLDPVAGVVDQTTDLVVDTTQTLDLSEPLSSINEAVSDATTQVVGTTRKLVDAAGHVIGTPEGSGEASDQGGSTDPAAGKSSATSKQASAGAASAPAHRAPLSTVGSAGMVVSSAVTSSRFTTAHAPPPPRSRASGPGGLATTGWDVAVPLTVLVLLATVGFASRLAERRRAGIPRGEWRYRGRHRAAPRWRPRLSPAPA